MRASTNKTLPVPLSASSSSSSPAPRGALARALSALRLDSALHDYDTFTDDAVEERVTMLGIHEADIAGLCDLCPGVQIRRVRPGGEDFWRIDAWLPKRTLGSVRTWGDGVGVEPDTCRVLADACDATGQVVLRAGQVVTVERRAERGEMKVCDLSGAGLGFALADTPVEVLGEAAALQALADYYSPGAWRVHPAPGGGYLVRSAAAQRLRWHKGPAQAVRRWLGDEAHAQRGKAAAAEFFPHTFSEGVCIHCQAGWSSPAHVKSPYECPSLRQKMEALQPTPCKTAPAAGDEGSTSEVAP